MVVDQVFGVLKEIVNIYGMFALLTDLNSFHSSKSDDWLTWRGNSPTVKDCVCLAQQRQQAFFMVVHQPVNLVDVTIAEKGVSAHIFRTKIRICGDRSGQAETQLQGDYFATLTFIVFPVAALFNTVYLKGEASWSITHPPQQHRQPPNPNSSSTQKWPHNKCNSFYRLTSVTA